MINKILMVVDYQYDFVASDGALPVPNADSIAFNIQREIDSNDYDSIIYSFDTHTREAYFNSEEQKLFPDIHCEFGTPGWNFYKIKPKYKNWDNFIANRGVGKGIDPFDTFIAGNEFFFTKDVFDIWQGNSNFESIILNNFKPNETEITVVGVATNYCVFMNVMGFVERGYKVKVLDSAVKGITNFPDGSEDESYQKNINVMKNRGVTFSGETK